MIRPHGWIASVPCRFRLNGCRRLSGPLISRRLCRRCTQRSTPPEAPGISFLARLPARLGSSPPRLLLLRHPVFGDPLLTHETEIGLAAAPVPPHDPRNRSEDSK